MINWGSNQLSSEKVLFANKKNIMSVQLPVEPAYYKMFIDNENLLVETEIELSSKKEAEELVHTKISDYKIPTFDETKFVGK